MEKYECKSSYANRAGKWVIFRNHIADEWNIYNINDNDLVLSMKEN